MATVPLSGTNIRFLSGVPFQNDYKNTRWFDTSSEQTNYFNSKPRVHTMTDANFQRIEGFHFIRVNKSIDDLWGTSYLMFQNSHYNNKWFYAFVTKLEYVQKNMTNVHFQIDVLQTWRFEMNFKPSFVKREHCPLWDSSGRPIVNTVDEGLNYGTEYDTVSIENYRPFNDLYFLVIVAKSRLHGVQAKQITATNNGLPQPLCYYIHPFRLDGSVPNVQLGSSYTISNILDLLSVIYSQDDAVNNIASMYITDYIGINAGYDGSTIHFNTSEISTAPISDNQNRNVDSLFVANKPNYASRSQNFGSKYGSYSSVKESKLLMYPYTTLILDDFKGNRVELKNEYIDSDNISVVARGSMGVSNKVTYGLTSYLTSLLPSGSDKMMISLENSLINNSPNDVPIISDYLSAYLQGNKNSIEHQKNTAMWNGAMSVVSSGVGGVGSAVSGNPLGVAGSVVGATQGMGSAVLQLQGIEAKIKDINNIPPQIVKMGGNTAYDHGNGYNGVFIIKKQIKPEYRKKLSDFFNMFGYKVNEVKVPNFHTRTHWNYVETTSCIITGNFNNEDLSELKSIFDSGITLWHTDDIGNYSLENGVI